MNTDCINKNNLTLNDFYKEFEDFMVTMNFLGYTTFANTDFITNTFYSDFSKLVTIVSNSNNDNTMEYSILLTENVIHKFSVNIDSINDIVKSYLLSTLIYNNKVNIISEIIHDHRLKHHYSNYKRKPIVEKKLLYKKFDAAENREYDIDKNMSIDMFLKRIYCLVFTKKSDNILKIKNQLGKFLLRLLSFKYGLYYEFQANKKFETDLIKAKSDKIIKLDDELYELIAKTSKFAAYFGKKRVKANYFTYAFDTFYDSGVDEPNYRDVAFNKYLNNIKFHINVYPKSYTDNTLTNNFNIWRFDFTYLDIRKLTNAIIARYRDKGFNIKNISELDNIMLKCLTKLCDRIDNIISKYLIIAIYTRSSIEFDRWQLINYR